MYLGLDIGTTSICALVVNEKGNIVYSVTKENNSHNNSKDKERTQNPEIIYNVCNDIYNSVLEKYKIESIGISGQMHGILYVDDIGEAISPLYSWQDERGNIPYKDSTYAKELSKITGYKMATGFGLTSIYYDFINNNIPNNASSFSTIGDYIAMKLVKRNKPLLNNTNAASLGLFDIKTNKWDFEAIERVNLPRTLFPSVTKDIEIVGYTKDNIPVYTAIGDNQASVYGVEQDNDSIIINIGTGSQISIITDKYSTPPLTCEYRPYFHGKYLALGCALCGGYSYKLLKDFFNSVSKSEITYDEMNKWAEDALNSNVPTFNPLFRGTRTNPDLKASISDITENNFNASSFTLSILKGISNELKEFYDLLISVTGERKKLIASGNAIRLNPVLRKVVEDDFKMKLNIPLHKEEAAFGAALIAAETFKNKSLKELIKYSS